MLDWYKTHWDHVIGYGTIFNSIHHGWWGFIFKSCECSHTILQQMWLLEKSFHSLKEWHPLFDYGDEFATKMLVLVTVT